MPQTRYDAIINHRYCPHTNRAQGNYYLLLSYPTHGEAYKHKSNPPDIPFVNVASSVRQVYTWTAAWAVGGWTTYALRVRYVIRE